MEKKERYGVGQQDFRVLRSRGCVYVLETPKYVYIIELKYDGTAESAIRQIEERHYARPYDNERRRIFKIGVSFSSKTRCIENWKIAD